MAVGVLKGTVGSDSLIPPYRLMERCLGDRLALRDQNASPPISTPGYATALSRANRGFPWRSVGANKDATTTGASAGPKTSDQAVESCAERSSNIR
jgi:hypothetical protein